MSFDLAAARAVCEAATPGPWQHGYNDGSGLIGEDSGGYIIPLNCESRSPVVWGGENGGIMLAEDAAFIAQARTLLPQALDEIARLREALETITKEYPGRYRTTPSYVNEIHNIARAALGPDTAEEGEG